MERQRVSAILGLALLLIDAALCGVGVAAPGAAPPNILMIVSDDQGYHDLGLVNPAIRTPNLDQLAREGTRLTQFYVTFPKCTPSRASLLTGRYPQRHGLYDMIRNEAPDYGYHYRSAAEYAATWERIGGLDTREVLLPEMLKQAGYATAVYGKWDLGMLRRYLPTSRGFDDFYGFVNTGIDYYTHERYGVPSMVRNETPTEEDRGIYATALFEREALRFLTERDPNRPFFLYVPFNAPHSASSLDPEIRGTVQAPPAFESLYPPVDPAFRNGERYGLPARLPTREKQQRDYRAAVTCMDHAVGRLLEALDNQGVADHTIVLFLSDNGGGVGSSNAPLRGGKGRLWEGGVRVLCLVRWTAGGVPAGQVSDAFLSSLEILPSLLTAAGVVPPANLVLDGHDWWPTLRGAAPSPRTRLFWQNRDHRAARIGFWKWIEIQGQTGLYNLLDDPGEQHDLAAAQPAILSRIQTRFADWVHETMVEAAPRGPFKDY